MPPLRQAAVQAGLRSEVRRPHLLTTVRFLPFAECAACPLVLLQLDDGRQALVRLTSSAARSHPFVQAYGGPASAAAALRAHAAEHARTGW